ncbi:MAG: hypothetical protein ACRDOB_11850 [Streptosporangiaceae bacterium]
MTITTDMPVSPAGSTLAPYTAANGDIVQPGCYGVSHGSGITGELIRHATESWAGHAFVYVGNGQIIEAAPPVARVSSAASHPDAVWNVHYPLTDPQRDAIVARAHALVGCPYDYPAYVGFALEVLKLRSGQELDPVFKEDHWRVCSALVADCYSYAGLNLEQGLQYPNLISPADLYNMIAHQA